MQRAFTVSVRFAAVMLFVACSFAIPSGDAKAQYLGYDGYYDDGPPDDYPGPRGSTYDKQYEPRSYRRLPDAGDERRYNNYGRPPPYAQSYDDDDYPPYYSRRKRQPSYDSRREDPREPEDGSRSSTGKNRDALKKPTTGIKSREAQTAPHSSNQAVVPPLPEPRGGRDKVNPAMAVASQDPASVEQTEKPAEAAQKDSPASVSQPQQQQQPAAPPAMAAVAPAGDAQPRASAQSGAAGPRTFDVAAGGRDTADRQTNEMQVSPDSASSRPEKGAGDPSVLDKTAALPRAEPPPADQLTRMIGQMLLVSFEGSNPDDDGVRQIIGQIKAGRIGGVVLRSRNVKSPEQLRRLTSALQSAQNSALLLIAVDQPGGDAQILSRAKGFQFYPGPSAIGRSNDPLKAYQTYTNLARELRSLGINVNLGPDADLDRTTSTPDGVAKDETYGSDPLHVTAFVKAFTSAHRDQGVLTVIKHFPGTGGAGTYANDTSQDISKTWREAELEPYKAGAGAKFADMVMVGHAAGASFSDMAGTPASLSRMTVQMLLRGKLGYEGVTMTGDLEAAGVTKVPFEERTVRAVEAGNDILLFAHMKRYDPELPERAIDVIRQAVQSGRLSQERIRTSYDRILYMKRKLAKAQQNLPAAAGNRPQRASSTAASPTAQAVNNAR